MSPKLPSAVPEIPVSDMAVATAYYERNLGFSLDWSGGVDDLAGLSRDSCRLFLAGPKFRSERGNKIPTLTWLNLASKAEVDALHQEWHARKAVLVSAPEDKPWGLREFTAADPDGNLFRVFYDFATPEREKARADRGWGWTRWSPAPGTRSGRLGRIFATPLRATLSATFLLL